MTGHGMFSYSPASPYSMYVDTFNLKGQHRGDDFSIRNTFLTKFNSTPEGMMVTKELVDSQTSCN